VAFSIQKWAGSWFYIKAKWKATITFAKIFLQFIYAFKLTVGLSRGLYGRRRVANMGALSGFSRAAALDVWGLKGFDKKPLYASRA
jgi:hypothetical protein